MEPRSIERGNHERALGCDSKALMLQWSHAQLSVETGEPALLSPHIIIASMEPRQFSVETTVLIAYQVTLRASMEPRSIERGNSGEGRRHAHVALASMEPRSIERGNEVPSPLASP